MPNEQQKHGLQRISPASWQCSSADVNSIKYGRAVPIAMAVVPSLSARLLGGCDYLKWKSTHNHA